MGHLIDQDVFMDIELHVRNLLLEKDNMSRYYSPGFLAQLLRRGPCGGAVSETLDRGCMETRLHGSEVT